MARTSRRPHNNHDLQADLANIKAALAQATQDVKGKTGEMFLNSYNDFKDRTSDATENVGEYVAAKPIKSIAIAAVVGFIAGYLFK